MFTKQQRKARRSRKIKHRNLRLEMLSQRQLMAADISFADGIIDIEGTNNRDIIQIDGSSTGLGYITIRNSSGNIVDDAYFWGPNFSEIHVRALGGHDHVENNTDISSKQWGGTGDDTLLGGTARDELRGDTGNDRLEGHDGNDYLSGWDDNDTILGGNGDDDIYGGAGDDWLYGGDGNDFLAGWTGVDRIYGQNDDDTLKGGDHDDRLYGGSGNDLLQGQAGNDYLYGNGDHDTLQGGDGDDYLSGSSGNDNLYGGKGEDDLNGGSGDDGLFGGADDDELNGGTGDDRFLVNRDANTGYIADILEDIAWNDARINFQDGEGRKFESSGDRWAEFADGSFTDAEIERVDLALAELHGLTGNTRLLKRANGGELTFERMGPRLKGNFTPNGYNNSLTGTVVLLDNGFAQTDDRLSQTVIHEVGHNFDNENLRWKQWKSISGWTKTVGKDKDDYRQSGDGTWFYKNTASFARNYGRFDPLEDFATYFAKTVMSMTGLTYDDDGSGGSDPLKDQFMMDFINDMKV
ncbi:calcium-binding protein [Stieleria varia]|uniref:Hemolysin, plasmid n=1 Tax=Stieleria varia TaxID=2528005 RepID=A0A5C6B7D1_9BACT|nr:calcium-binding protein [Stieleria varia]TWU08155.1 Hemolysin, plasmid [Stieleria varia]